MQEKTSQKTTQNITNTTRTTERDVGSDEYMIRYGFHPASQEERAKYGKFAHDEGIVAIVSGWIKRSVHRTIGQTSTEPVVVLSASRTTGSTFPPDRQPQGQSHTPQNEVVLTAVWQERAERWKMIRWVEPELQR